MSIALSLGNNLTTNGVFKPAAVNNTSVNNVTTFASIPAGGALILLSTQTASASASIEFTSGIDSTYDSYIFKFINIHPATDNVDLRFQASTDGGSTYGVTLTSSCFAAAHDEAGTTTVFAYNSTADLAQSTSFQALAPDIGNGSDESGSGTLQIFNPSSTTFVKHWLSTFAVYNYNDYSNRRTYGGYFNTTSAIDAIKFQMQSDNIGDGIIKMYGVKKS